MKISKNKKMRFFLMSQGSFNPKIRFLGQKVCSVARLQTDRQTDTQTDTHESDYCGHPFRVSGVFPSTYHQGSAQQFAFLRFKKRPFSVQINENKLPKEEIEKLAVDYKATIHKAEEDIFHATQNLNVMINSLAIEKGNNGKLIPY